MDVYREDEKARYEPPACPGCGRRVQQDWVDVTCSADFADHGKRMLTPGRWECVTPGCSYNPHTGR